MSALWDRKHPRIENFKRTCGDLTMARGVAMWQRGGRPEHQPTDEDAEKVTPDFLLWLGYMGARAIDAMERRKIADALENFDADIKCRD